MSNFENDELLFSQKVEEIKPILDTMSDLLKDGRISLSNMKHRMGNNHLTIMDQQKTISEQQILIDEAKNKAQSIISMAEERAKEIEKGISIRLAETAHRDRVSKAKLEEADKILWDSKNKKKEKVA